MRFLRYVLPRVVSILSYEYPLLLFLPGLIAGQLAVLCWTWSALIAAGAICLIVACLWRQAPAFFRILSCALVVGVISAVVSWPQRFFPTKIPSGEKILLVEVSAVPRYFRIQQKTLTLTLHQWKEVAADEEWRTIRFPLLVYCKAVDLPWRNINRIQQGDLFVIRADIHPIRFQGMLDYQSMQARRGYSAECKIKSATRALHSDPAWEQQIRDRVIRKVEMVEKREIERALFFSMGLGVRDLLPYRIEEAFKRAGLAHLLVVSGLQITLFFFSLRALIKFFLCQIYYYAPCDHIEMVATCGGLLVACFFLFWTGTEGPTVRALLAALFVSIAILTGRGGGALNALAFSLMVLALVWPGCYLEPGTQLTYAALLGLLLGSGDKTCSALKRYCVSCFLATLYTSCVVLIWFDMFSPLSFILNPVLAPLFSFISCQVGFLGLAGLFLGVDSGGVLIQAVMTLLRYGADCVESLSQLSFAVYKIESPGIKCVFVAVFLLISSRFTSVGQYLLREFYRIAALVMKKRGRASL